MILDPLDLHHNVVDPLALGGADLHLGKGVLVGGVEGQQSACTSRPAWTNQCLLEKEAVGFNAKCNSLGCLGGHPCSAW